MLIDTKELLKPPVGRAAYSDRTAWLMAEMSRLAYLTFEGPAAVRESLVEDLAKLTDKTAIEAKLQEVEQLLLSSGDQRDALEELPGHEARVPRLPFRERNATRRTWNC